MYYTTAFASTSHVDEIARVGYEAFRDVAVRHSLEPDFPSVALARKVYQMLVDRSDYYGVVALINGKVVGSNFVSTTDRISGIGPLSVDPEYQGRGIGRSLMNEVIEFTKKHRISQVRLLQDAHNLSSLSLYSSLGFQARDVIALTTVVPGPTPDRTVRHMKECDLPEVEQLSQRLCKTSRYNEISIALNQGFPAVVREQQNDICGYLLPGLVGHGVSSSEDDAFALLQHAARSMPPAFARLFCPLRYPGLLRSLLSAGGKIEKTLTYMTLGAYEYPDGVYTPSAGY